MKRFIYLFGCTFFFFFPVDVPQITRTGSYGLLSAYIQAGRPFSGSLSLCLRSARAYATPTPFTSYLRERRYPRVRSDSTGGGGLWPQPGQGKLFSLFFFLFCFHSPRPPTHRSPRRRRRAPAVGVVRSDGGVFIYLFFFFSLAGQKIILYYVIITRRTAVVNFNRNDDVLRASKRHRGERRWGRRIRKRHTAPYPLTLWPYFYNSHTCSLARSDRRALHSCPEQNTPNDTLHIIIFVIIKCSFFFFFFLFQYVIIVYVLFTYSVHRSLNTTLPYTIIVM